jgi:integrase
MATKRSKGDGGLVQRHDHATCPPLVNGQRAKHACRGRWVGTLNVNLPNGRTKRKSLYGRTKAEAKAKLDRANREKAAGTLVATSPTVAAWMTSWLEKKRQPPKSLKPNTWNGYESKVRLYIVPALGKKRLSDLRPQHIEAMYDDLRDRGLKEATIRQTHMILQKALVDAVRKDALGRTPMDRVDPPGTETEDREQWTLEQAFRALRAAGDSARWWLAVFYGMRQGEVLGMQWQYVDWTRNTFWVEETRQNDYGYSGAILGDPKAEASHRELPMVGQIEIRLRLLWEQQGKPTTGLVFPNGAGKLKDAKADWTSWRAFIDSATVAPFAPLPYIALHAARNTAASLMEAHGIPDRVVAQILGQSQVRTTHGYQRAEVERLRGYLDAVAKPLELEA